MPTPAPSRRRVLAMVVGAAGAAALAACPAPAAAPAAATKPAADAKPAAQPPAGTKQVEIRAHMVKKQDVSDWIETAMKQDIDGFQAKNPGIKITLDLVPGFLAEFVPKILALTAGGQLGDIT